MTMRNARVYLSYGKTTVVYDDNSRIDANKGLSIGAAVEF
jgi:hypothetical protein